MGNRPYQDRSFFQNQFDILQSSSGFYKIQNRQNKEIFIARQLLCNNQRELFELQSIMNQKLKNPSPYNTRLAFQYNDYKFGLCSKDNRYYVLYRQIPKILYDQMNQRSFKGKTFQLQQIDSVVNRIAKGIKYVYDISHYHGHISPFSIAWPLRPTQSIQLIDQWIIPGQNSMFNKSRPYFPRNQQQIDQKILMHTSDLYNLGIVASQMTNISGGKTILSNQPGYNQLAAKIQTLLSPIPIQRMRIYNMINNVIDNNPYQPNLFNAQNIPYEAPISTQITYQQPIQTPIQAPIPVINHQPIINNPLINNKPLENQQVMVSRIQPGIHQTTSSLPKAKYSTVGPSPTRFNLNQVNVAPTPQNRSLNISVSKNQTNVSFPQPNLNPSTLSRNPSINKFPPPPISTTNSINIKVPPPSIPSTNLNFKPNLPTPIQNPVNTNPSIIQNNISLSAPAPAPRNLFHTYNIAPKQVIPNNKSIYSSNIQIPKININGNTINSKISTVPNAVPSALKKSMINFPTPNVNHSFLLPAPNQHLQKVGRSRSASNFSSINNVTFNNNVNQVNKLDTSLNPTVNFNFTNNNISNEPVLSNSPSLPSFHSNFHASTYQNNLITGNGLTFSFGQNSPDPTLSFKVSGDNNNSVDQSLFTSPDFFNKIKNLSFTKQSEHHTSFPTINNAIKANTSMQSGTESIPEGTITNPLHILQNSFFKSQSQQQYHPISEQTTNSFLNQKMKTSTTNNDNIFLELSMTNSHIAQSPAKYVIQDNKQKNLVKQHQKYIQQQKRQKQIQQQQQLILKKQKQLLKQIEMQKQLQRQRQKLMQRQIELERQMQMEKIKLRQIENQRKNEQFKQFGVKSEKISILQKDIQQKQPISTATMEKNNIDSQLLSDINFMKEAERKRSREKQKNNNVLFKSTQIDDDVFSYKFKNNQVKLQAKTQNKLKNFINVKKFDQTPLQFYQKIALPSFSSYNTSYNTSFDHKFDTKLDNNYQYKYESTKYDPKSENYNYSYTSTNTFTNNYNKYDNQYGINKYNSDFDAKYDTKYDNKYDAKYDNKYDTKYQTKYQTKYDDGKYQNKYDDKYDNKYESKYDDKYDNKYDVKFDNKYETKSNDLDIKFENRYKLKIKQNPDKNYQYNSLSTGIGKQAAIAGISNLSNNQSLIKDIKQDNQNNTYQVKSYNYNFDDNKDKNTNNFNIKDDTNNNKSTEKPGLLIEKLQVNEKNKESLNTNQYNNVDNEIFKNVNIKINNISGGDGNINTNGNIIGNNSQNITETKNNQNSTNIQHQIQQSNIHQHQKINIVIHQESKKKEQDKTDSYQQFYNKYSQGQKTNASDNLVMNKNTQNNSKDKDKSQNNVNINITENNQQENPQKNKTTPSKQQTARSNQPFSTIPQVSERSMSAKSDEERDYVIQQYENGSRYEGYKSNGMRNGKGKFFYQEGSFYDGQWKNNNMHGYGKLYYSNNKLAYEGEWFIDQFHGRGRVFNDDPAPVYGFFDYTNFQYLDEKWKYYQGDLVCDSKQGQGKLVLSNEQYYQGQFRNDKVEGKGKFVTKTGETIHGVWQDSKLFMKLQS